MSDEEKHIVREVDAAFAEDVLQAKARRCASPNCISR